MNNSEKVRANSRRPARPTNGMLKSDNNGLTKREHFAGLAMASLCAMGTDNMAYSYYAESAVKHADALLKELEK